MTEILLTRDLSLNSMNQFNYNHFKKRKHLLQKSMTVTTINPKQTFNSLHTLLTPFTNS